MASPALPLARCGALREGRLPLGFRSPLLMARGWESASLPESLTRHTGPTWYAVMREICVQITKVITALYKKQFEQYGTI